MGIQWPSQCVNHRARAEAIVRNFPELFDANRIDLWVRFTIQFEALNHLFCEGASHPFPQHRDLRGNVYSWFEIRLWFARFIDAFVSGPDPNNRVSVVQHFSTRK